MDSEITLTPAQLSFLGKHLPEFTDGGWTVSLAGQAGSQRLFYRIADPQTVGRSYILVVWDSRDEDWLRFLAIPRELSPHIDVFPEIFQHDDRHGLILEQDLGNVTLKIACEQRSQHDEIESAYRRVIDSLAHWHRLDISLSPTISARALDFETFMWETDYFARRCVVDFCGGERLLDGAWEKERKALAAQAAALPKTFVHRDFQSENVMMTADGIKFVDFQGARLGPPEYDLASLLFDPYSGFLDDGLLYRLATEYGHQRRVPVERRAIDLCAAQRLMQALGAYGNLSIHHGKTRYRDFVPVALTRLCRVLERLPEFKALSQVAGGCHEALASASAR